MLEDLKSVVKGTFIYGLGNLSVKLVGFVLLPLYTEYISITYYGILALLESISQILVAVFSLNLTSALFRWYWDERYKDKQKSIFLTSLAFTSGLAVLMVASLIPFESHASSLIFGIDVSGLLTLMLVFSALEIISSIPATLLRLQEKASLYASVMILRVIVSLVGTLVLIVYVSPTVHSIYVAQIMASLIYLIVLLPYVLKNIEIRFELSILNEMLRFSVPLVLGSISMILISFADRYLLKYYGVFSDVGLYSLGFKIANVILFVVMSVQLALTPMIYKSIDRPDNKRFISKTLTYLSFAIMFFVIGVSSFGGEIIKVLAGNPEYWEAHQVIPIVSLAIFFGMARDSVTAGLLIVRKTRLLSFINSLMAMLNLILDLLLIPKFRIIGAATANLLTMICSFLLYYRASQKSYFIPYEMSKLSTIVLVGVSLYVASELASVLPLTPRLFIKFGLCIAYPIVLYQLRFFEEIELLRIKQGWQKWRQIRRWRSYLRDL